MTEPRMPQQKAIVQMEGEERRAEIIAMYRAGIPQKEIAEQFGISASGVKYHVERQREIWRNSALVDFNEAQGRVLELLDKTEQEAWNAWEQSKKPLVMQIRYLNKHGDPANQIRQNNRDGDPRFLQIALDCAEKRMKLLGLVTTKHEVTHNQGQKITMVEVVKSKKEDDEQPVLD